MKSCGIFILLVVAVIAGLALGLLIGWVLWPVQWINASPESMRFEFQMDWMNMAIDSYSVNQNDQLAAERYSYLGADGPVALAAVTKDPVWVTPDQVQAYTDAVSSQEALTTQPAESTGATTSITSRLFRPPLLGYVVVVLFLALIAIVLLIVLVIRLVGRKPEPETVPATVGVAETPSEDVTSAEVVTTEEVQQGEEGISPAEAAAVAAAAGAVSESTAVEDTAPIAVSEETEEPQQEPAEEGGGVSAGVIAGTAALVGAAAAVASSSGEEEQEESPEAEEVVRAVEEVGASETSLDGIADTVEEAVTEGTAEKEAVGHLGEAAALGAAAAGVGWALEKEPEEEEKIAESEGEAGEVEESGEILAEEAGTQEWLPETPAGPMPPEFYGKYNRKVIDIEGIGEVYAERLSEVGITTTHALLQQCSTTKGREELAERTGISHKLILEWANHADIMRIQGIGPQWSDLLEMAGVNTVREMAMRNPENLYNTLIEINEEKKLVRQLPSEAQVEDWIEQAKELPRILTY
jgi:predicted flap endonuclease-1-like 5' DNA nuclease